MEALVIYIFAYLIDFSWVGVNFGTAPHFRRLFLRIIKCSDFAVNSHSVQFFSVSNFKFLNMYFYLKYQYSLQFLHKTESITTVLIKLHTYLKLLHTIHPKTFNSVVLVNGANLLKLKFYSHRKSGI